MPLTTLSAASPRPAECRGAPAGEDSELWSRTRGETTRRYCALLARGYARLDRAPAEALELAETASRLLPSRAEPRVLAGRARVRLGDWDAARALLEVNVSAPGRPLGDVGALRELAIALGVNGRPEQAALTYRLLVPRSEFAQDRLFARTVLLEAAVASMASGPRGLDEALLYLGDARQKAPVPGLSDLTTALFALALDRAGRREQVDVALAELPGVWALERFLSAAEHARLVGLALPGASAPDSVEAAFSDARPHFVDGELSAALGVAGAPSDPRLARAHLTAYLAGPGGRGPWADWARARLGAAPKQRERAP